MKKLLCISLMLLLAPLGFADSLEPFLGNWALVLPGDGPGWLQVKQEHRYLDGSLLWYGGSVNPLESVYLDGDTLYATRSREVERKDDEGSTVRKQRLTDIYTFTVSGDTLTGELASPRNNGMGVDRHAFTGKRNPPLPDPPDLSKVKFGEPITLFNGENLEGWIVSPPTARSAWRAEGGLLINEPPHREGAIKIPYGNLRTEQEFDDFNLTLEVNVPPNGNSGIYLRGIYEVQVADTYGKPLNAHNMGGIYSRYAPLVAAEKPAGEWQHYDITLVNRHVTIKLNGELIHDNTPLEGCTGGALWSDEFRPGPIYLQGDHTAVQYRNIVLTPVIPES